MKRILSANQGFIFVEVLFILIILSVALIPISGMFMQAVQGNRVAEEYTVAVNLMQKQLELLKLHSPAYWAQLILPCNIPWQDDRLVPAPKYDIITQAISFNPNLVQVTVIAFWQDKGIDYRVKFVTFYPTL